MSANHPNRILAVAQDAGVLQTLVDRAQLLNAHITPAATGTEAIDIDAVEVHNLVIAGVRLPDMSGCDCAGEILSRHRRPVILIGDDPAADDVIRALRLGVADFLLRYLPAGRADCLDQAVAAHFKMLPSRRLRKRCLVVGFQVQRFQLQDAADHLAN